MQGTEIATGDQKRYEELVRRVANGQQVDDSERARILSAVGKSIGDLQSDIESANVRSQT